MGNSEKWYENTDTGNQSTITITTTTTIPAGTSITVTIYEDVGNDDTGPNSVTDADGTVHNYENADSVVLSGGVDETNDLTGFDGGGSTNAYITLVELDGDGSDPTLDSPQFNRITYNFAEGNAITVSLPIESSSTKEPEPTVTAPTTVPTGVENVPLSEPVLSVGASATIGLGVESIGSTEPEPTLSAPSVVTVPIESWSVEEPTVTVDGTTTVGIPVGIISVTEPEPSIKLIIVADTVSLSSSWNINVNLKSTWDLIEELKSAGENKQQ